MKTGKFWIVLVRGSEVPEIGFHAHATLQDAQEEAARLIRKERQSAVIMESILLGEIELYPIKWSSL